MLHIILLVFWYAFLIWLGVKLLGAMFDLVRNKDGCADQQAKLVEHVLTNSFPWKYIGPRSK